MESNFEKEKKREGKENSREGKKRKEIEKERRSTLKRKNEEEDRNVIIPSKRLFIVCLTNFLCVGSDYITD